MIKIAERSWKMFNIDFFGGDRSRLLNIVADWLDLKMNNKWIATVNPEFIMKACKDRHFMQMLNETDLNVVDGNGLAWAAKLKRGLKVEVIPGSDLINDLCALAEQNGYSVFFLGGWGERAQKSAKYFKEKYPKLKIIGNYAGKNEGEDKKTLKIIGKNRIDILFVAYGMGKQEEWIYRNVKKLNVGLAIGLGRTFDYYSGELKRAPLIWRKMRLEWLYSFIQEPKRWRRQLVLPIFALKVLFQGRD